MEKAQRTFVVSGVCDGERVEARWVDGRLDCPEVLLRRAEVIVAQDHRPVAVIKTPQGAGRLLSEAIALAEARGSTATLDEGFMKDVEEGIASRSQPSTPPAWG